MSAVRCCRQRRWPGGMDSEGISSGATKCAFPSTQFVTGYTPRQIGGKQSPIRNAPRPQLIEARAGGQVVAREVPRLSDSHSFVRSLILLYCSPAQLSPALGGAATYCHNSISSNRWTTTKSSLIMNISPFTISWAATSFTIRRAAT